MIDRSSHADHKCSAVIGSSLLITVQQSTLENIQLEGRDSHAVLLLLFLQSR